MKKTNVFYMGKKLCEIYPHATKWQVFKYKVRRIIRMVFGFCLIIAVLLGVYKLGGILSPATIYTKAEIIKEVPIKAPVMDRIAMCESQASHTDKNGQVQLNANTNGSVDIGIYQINNKAWGKKATELHYNLMVEQDNRAMAQYIYETHGTEPWYSSKKCWNK